MPVGTPTTKALLFWGAVLLPGLVLGSGKGESSANGNQAATDTTPAAATNAPAGGTTSAAGEVAPSPAIANWTDNNIVANLATADKGEVQIGKLAESKATIPAVKDYARMLVTDHSKAQKEVEALAGKAKLKPQSASDDTTAKAGADIVKALTSLPKGKDWDSTFVKHEYDDHQHDIADAKAMQVQAKDAQLKQLIGSELPVLQKHLDAAAKLLGNAPGSSAVWKNSEFRKTESDSGKSQRSKKPSGTKY